MEHLVVRKLGLRETLHGTPGDGGKPHDPVAKLRALGNGLIDPTNRAGFSEDMQGGGRWWTETTTQRHEPQNDVIEEFPRANTRAIMQPKRTSCCRAANDQTGDKHDVENRSSWGVCAKQIQLPFGHLSRFEWYN